MHDGIDHPKGSPLLGLLVQVRYIIAHPNHCPANLAFEPNRSPLRRPVMGVPYFMPKVYRRGQSLHVEISAKESNLAQPGKMATPNLNDLEVFAYLRKTI